MPDLYFRQTKMRTIYRFGGIISVQGNTGNAFQETISSIMQYCAKNHVEALSGIKGTEDFSSRGINYNADCVVIPEIFTWALRLRFLTGTDFNDGMTEPEIWHYEIGITESHEGLLFGIEISTEWNSVLSEFFPGLIAFLGEKLRQGRQLDGRPMMIRNREEAEQLYDLVCNKARILPVVVISAIHPGAWNFTPDPPNYLIDASAFAARTLGYAFVAQMTSEGAREWSHIIGPTWAVYDGAIRIFNSNFDASYGGTSEHRAYFKDEVWNFKYNLICGSKAFFAYLLILLRRNASFSYIDRNELFFYSDIGIAKTIFGKLDNSDKIRRMAEREKDLLSENEQLREQFGCEQKKNRALVGELRQLTNRNRDYEDIVSSMQRSIEQLSGCPKDVPVTAKASVEIPETYEDMVLWTQVYLADRLYLHPRAMRAIEKAEYQDPQLVYRALLALAFEYRDSRLGLSDEKPFKQRCSELGLQKRSSISKGRAGEEGDRYFVNYPFHTSKRCLLQWHLGKGNSRKKAYCLRIYYFWDEDSKTVVVGYLPGHLNNRIS